MTFSRDGARKYQLSMAVACTVLASVGFISAGYASNSASDAAMQTWQRATQAPSTESVLADKFTDSDSLEVPRQAKTVSFANTLIMADKPAAKQVLDLTDPQGNTPELAGVVSAMRANAPEISADVISKVRKEILEAAYKGLGHHYVWGGTSFISGWDCSGFVQWAYAQAGIGLPRTEQWRTMVETSNPQPGDIVVQNPDGPNHWSHIGIYIGHGQMISALNPSVGTIMHAPSATSSSSSYFTVPGFAALDEQAAKDRAAKEKAEQTKKSTSATDDPQQSTKATTSKSAKPSQESKTTAPVKTSPATTAPVTTPPPATTSPGTMPPVTTPSTTAPATTHPATTPPVTTPPPVTTTPTTTAPRKTPATATPSPTKSSTQSSTAELTPGATGSTP